MAGGNTLKHIRDAVQEANPNIPDDYIPKDINKKLSSFSSAEERVNLVVESFKSGIEKETFSNYYGLFFGFKKHGLTDSYKEQYIDEELWNLLEKSKVPINSYYESVTKFISQAPEHIKDGFFNNAIFQEYLNKSLKHIGKMGDSKIITDKSYFDEKFTQPYENTRLKKSAKQALKYLLKKGKVCDSEALETMSKENSTERQ